MVRFCKDQIERNTQLLQIKGSPILAEKLIQGIIDSTKQLMEYPESGRLEYYKTNLNFLFRSVKYKKYKVIYIYREDRIEVVHVFDMRQDPGKIIEEIYQIKKDLD